METNLLVFALIFYTATLLLHACLSSPAPKTTSMPRPGFAKTADSTSPHPEPLMAPSWLQCWRQRQDGGPWGFVGFRTACYGDEQKWEEFKNKVQKIIEIPFTSAMEQGYPPHEIEAAQAQFEIRWIEDPDLASADAEKLRAKYGALLPELPPGLSFSHQSLRIFLCASPEAVASVLSLSPTELPTSESKRWRPKAPFLLAITPYADPGLEEGHEERGWFKPVFKIAAEVLVEEMWWLLEAGFITLRKITRMVRGSSELGKVEGLGGSDGDNLDDMWWSMHSSPERMRRRRQFLPSF